MTVGERIKYIRIQLKLNQTDFAHKLGLKTSVSVSNYENGTREPDFATIIKIASLGCTTLDWLLKGVGNPPYQKILASEKESDDLPEKLPGQVPCKNAAKGSQSLVLTNDEFEIIQKMRMLPGSQKLLNQLLDGRLKIQEAFHNFSKITLDDTSETSIKTDKVKTPNK